MNVSLTQYRQLLVKYLRSQRWRAVLLAGLLLGSIALQLLNPQILRRFIDTAVAGGATGQLVAAALLFIAVALSNQALAVAATYVGEVVGWTATNMLRADLAAHCLRLDMPFHKSRTPGEMIERIDGDVTALSNFFSRFVIQVLGSGLLMLGVLVALFREDWRVGLALTIFALVSLVALIRIRSFAVEAVTADREAQAGMFGFLEERLNGLDDLRANAGGGYTLMGWYRALATHYRTGSRAMRRNAMMWTVIIGLFALGSALALGLGGYLYQRGAVSIGTVYLIFQYTQLLRHPLEQLTDQLRELQRAAASVGRVQELLSLAPAITDGPGAALPSAALPVAFDDVGFRYEDDEAPVLQNLSFALAPGRVLGLLGRTGSGKTTLTRLLFRLYDPTAGAIRLDGVDLRDLTLAQLRQRVGIVTQDVQLFRATVRDNLTFFDPAISDEQILAVLNEMGLQEWLAALPQGLDTELAPGGGGLSAGESQLLAFTRVFLKDPGLVILDEASSRLDPATEQLIERAVDRLLHNRTGIIIAHRLGTVQRADEIMILEAGQVIEHDRRDRLARDPRSRFAHLLQTGLEEVLV